MELQTFILNWGFRSLNCLNRAPVKRNELQLPESLPELPDSAVANTLSFYPNMITKKIDLNTMKESYYVIG